MLYYSRTSKARQDTLHVCLRMMFHLYGPEPEARIELCLRIDLEVQSYS
ncbi:hypothetical protein M6B38_286600 [Iris pallida]|uniref:Uncharacterized protein n=1 Tax=Iris pallida TaxID=29817 RepID=A0AAX6HY04_IRIPA|nr:hypothetical protein M6B38_286600 [Iris pallida]